MRKIILTFIVLFAAISLNAQSISGIRVDGGDSPVLVYIGGSQMCLPTTSCFIANLKAGYYVVQVYASRNTRPGERVWKGQSLYNERVYFNGTGVKDIVINERSESRPGTRPGQNDRYPDRNTYNRLMDTRLFDGFYDSVKREISAADRIKLIDTAVVNSDFTSAQCLRLVNLFSFDADKMIIMRKLYPGIVDKQAFFTVLGTLKFSDSKVKMNEFIKNYNSNN